jgi:hypothetical protein
MGNMSYCRFRNTLQDLEDCFEAMEGSLEDLGADEQQALEELIDLCWAIAREYGGLE